MVAAGDFFKVAKTDVPSKVTWPTKDLGIASTLGQVFFFTENRVFFNLHCRLNTYFLFRVTIYLDLVLILSIFFLQSS